MLQEGRTWNGILVSHIKEFLAKVCLILVTIGFVDEFSSCFWCNTNFDANCFTWLLPLVIIPSTFLATTTSGGDDSHLHVFLLLRVIINYHMCIYGYYSCLYDNNSSNGWSFLIIFSSLLLLLLNFIKVHFFEGRKWKRCWFLEKNHSQGHDVVVEFIINVDFLQHTN